MGRSTLAASKGMLVHEHVHLYKFGETASYKVHGTERIGALRLTTLYLLSNSENCEHRKYFWNVIVFIGRSQSGVR